MKSEVIQAITRTLLTGVIFYGIFYLLFYLTKIWTRKRKVFLPTLLDKHFHMPALVLITFSIVNTTFDNFRPCISESAFGKLAHALEIAWIISFAFLIVRIIKVVRELLLHHYTEGEY